MNESKTVNISTNTIVRVILIILFLVFVYLIKNVIVIFLFALIIASAIAPMVNFLEKIKIPRVIGALLVYIFIIGILALVVYLIIPSFVRDAKNLASMLPQYVEKVLDKFNALKNTPSRYQGIINRIQTSAGELINYLQGKSSSLLSTAFGIFGGVFSFVMILIVSFYISVLKKGVQRILTAIIPIHYRDHILDLWERAQRKFGKWMQGQVILGAIVGVLAYLGLHFLNIKFALLLAVLAGLLEIFPYIGPVLAGIPAVIMGFLQAPIMGLWVLVLYVVIQQLENYLITPLVIGKVVGLNPVVVILALLVGGQLGGILGVILAVPLAAVFAEFLKDMIKRRNQAKQK
jgi:predicted PurR-regulated permease PerM